MAIKRIPPPIKNYYLPIDGSGGSCITTSLVSGEYDDEMKRRGYYRVSFLHYAWSTLLDLMKRNNYDDGGRQISEDTDHIAYYVDTSGSIASSCDDGRGDGFIKLNLRWEHSPSEVLLFLPAARWPRAAVILRWIELHEAYECNQSRADQAGIDRTGSIGDDITKQEDQQ
jgi:hypothetical protein